LNPSSVCFWAGGRTPRSDPGQGVGARRAVWDAGLGVAGMRLARSPGGDCKKGMAGGGEGSPRHWAGKRASFLQASASIGLFPVPSPAGNGSRDAAVFPGRAG